MVISDNQIQIKILDELIDKLYKYVQWTIKDCEAGGIIVGRENIDNGNIIIEKVSEPMENDYCKPRKFVRKDKGHLAFYEQLYNDNNSIYAYFGEWHTHFQDKPKYSVTDLITWRKINKESPRSVQYHIIVGRKYISFWEMKKNKFFPKLIKEVHWNEKNI